jgi:5-hydroxyisourate hydrolase-like protein (transthyretin family)
MSVSVHVIDCVYGRPAVAMSVGLSREIDGEYHEQWRDETDDDGRISALLKAPLPRGSYCLELDLDGYYRKLGLTPLNSAISVRFYMPSDTHYYGLSVLVTPSICITYKES